MLLDHQRWTLPYDSFVETAVFYSLFHVYFSASKQYQLYQVQAADSLLKLVSELKQTAVFSDFIVLNEHIEKRSAKFVQLSDDTEQLLVGVGDQIAASLQELESHYYNSPHRNLTEVADNSKMSGDQQDM